MLIFIDYLNKSNILTKDSILVSFGIVNIFPSIDNQSGLQAVKNTLEARQEQFPPTVCITEALKLCLESNKSVFNNNHFLQTDGTAQGPQMSCSYSEIAIESFNKKALHYHPSAILWKRFRDDVLLVWLHSIQDLDLFFNYVNNIVSTS